MWPFSKKEAEVAPEGIIFEHDRGDIVVYRSNHYMLVEDIIPYEEATGLTFLTAGGSFIVFRRDPSVETKKFIGRPNG